jgi:hypothetical protein
MLIDTSVAATKRLRHTTAELADLAGMKHPMFNELLVEARRLRNECR